MTKVLLFLLMIVAVGCKESTEDEATINTNQVSTVADDTDSVVVGRTYWIPLTDNYSLTSGSTRTDYYVISKENGYVHFRETGLTDRTSSMRTRVTYIRVGMMEEKRFKWMLKQGDLWGASPSVSNVLKRDSL